MTLDKTHEEYSIKNFFYITRSFDESKEKSGYTIREAWYNRDISVKYSLTFNRNFNSFKKFQINISVSYTKQNSYYQQLIPRDNIVITDKIKEGTQKGIIVLGLYLGEKWIEGDVWNIYLDFNYSSKFFIANYLNSLTLGFTFRNDFNKGDGKIFDSLFPPSLSIPTPRLTKYNELPSYPIIVFYAENKINGYLLLPFTFKSCL